MADSDPNTPTESFRSRARRWSLLVVGLGWPLSEWELTRNFRAMPKLLRWLTALGLCVTLFFVPVLIPGNTVRAFGRSISTQEWWLSGAGWIFACTYGLVPVSAVLMLRRSRYGRSLYVLACFTAIGFAPLAAWLVRAPGLLDLPSLVVGFIMVGLIALYLGRNRAVRKYFHVEAHPGQ